MSETPRRRGRPKGTGIDDSATLSAVLAMLAANDDLKPTTAIRRTGVTDPSVVRRLREKLKLEPQEQRSNPRLVPVSRPPVAATQPQKPPMRGPGSLPGASTQQPPRIQDTAARISEPSLNPQSNPPPVAATSRVETVKPPQPGPQSQSKSDQNVPPPSEQTHSPTGPSASAQPPPPAPDPQLPDPQLEALRLSAEAAAAMSKLYLHCVSNATQANPLTLALSTQTMMSQWFAGLVQAQINARKTPKA
jgi:hypothetical protein